MSWNGKTIPRIIFWRYLSTLKGYSAPKFNEIAKAYQLDSELLKDLIK